MDFIPLLPVSDDESNKEGNKLDLNQRKRIEKNTDTSEDAKRSLVSIPSGKKTPLYRTTAPWYNPSKQYNRIPVFKLHEEIIQFVSFIRPTIQEHHARAGVVFRLQSLVDQIFQKNKAQVRVFGSFETELYLPSSDIDIVILYNSSDKDLKDAVIKPPLNKLAKHIVSSGLADLGSCKTITRARIPIIKYTDKITNYAVDVSFNIDTGTDGIHYIKNLLREHRALRPLALVLKQFLEQRALNEPYTGGLGSYGLLCMIVSFFQMHPLIQSGLIDPMDFNLGTLLVDFLELYGRAFNYDIAAISIQKSNPCYLDKGEHDWKYERRLGQLAIEDPQQPENDLCRSAYCFSVVKQAFEHAYFLLTSVLKKPMVESECILASVIGVSEETIRHRFYIEQTTNI